MRVADIGIDAGVLAEIQPQTFENVPQALAPGRFRCRGSTATNTPAAMRSWCPAISPRPARRGWRRAAALRAGAGLVTLASPRDALAVNAAALTAVMVRAVDTVVEFAELLTDKRLNACVIGPGAGVGDRTRDFVLTALSAQRGLVLDADALTSFAEAPDRLFEAIKSSRDPAGRSDAA